MTSGIYQTSIGCSKAYRVGEGRCPGKRFEPGSRSAVTVVCGSSYIAESTVPLGSPANSGIRLLCESPRPVFRHTRIFAEMDAYLLSSKVSIRVVILCDRTSQGQLHPHVVPSPSPSLSSASDPAYVSATIGAT
jgi:hypothetical protein